MGRALSMILRSPTAIAVINGLAASREKSARHCFDSPSGQVTDMVSVETCTCTGPGFTPDVSTGIAASAARGAASKKMLPRFLIWLQVDSRLVLWEQLPGEAKFFQVRICRKHVFRNSLWSRPTATAIDPNPL